MNGLSQKIYLPMHVPTEEDPRSSQQRILDALAAEGISASLSLPVLQSMFPLLEQADYQVTASLCFNGYTWQVTGLTPGNTADEHYGLAVDLGSTTVVMELVNCNTGEVLAQESCYSHQIAYGEDILTRIFYTKNQPEHRKELQKATTDTLSQLMQTLSDSTGINTRACSCMIISGNTTMIHFLLGLDAFCVFSSPYAVQTDTPDFFWAKELGIPMEGMVYCYPCRANYMGGDIISGIVATGMNRREEISVFFDIGTNGELVMGNRDFLVCGAGAAGPALEGGVVKTGMRAADGAVEALKLSDDTFQLSVIGHGNPMGICGSGIVDLIAELFINGILDIRGKFSANSSRHLIYGKNGTPTGIEYAPGLIFDENDVQEFLRTKAAAYTMMQLTMEQTGITMADISDFYMAGSFGSHVNKESAIRIGMYPDVPHEQIHTVGNTSLMGARSLLLDRSILTELKDILDKMEYIQFGSIANFLEVMTAASYLPHIDLHRFPSVERELAKRQYTK